MKKTDEENELERDAHRETNRLVKLVRGTIPARAQVIRPLCENVGWMKAKLDRARARIGEDDLTIEYQHGKDQSGIIANPALTAYEMLFKSYISGLVKILDQLPPAEAQHTIEKEPKKTMLAIIQERREGAS